MARLSTTGLRRLAIALALSTPAFGLISLEARSAAPATPVQIKNFAFMPQPLTVKVGTTVTWTNSDDDPHTVTATDKSFHSAALDTSPRYSGVRWTAHPIVVRDSPVPALQLRYALYLHYESKSLVKQLGAWIRDGNIEGRAAMSIGIKAFQ